VLLTLTNLTIDQSQSHDRNALQLWKFTRKIRLTTTTAADVPKKSTTDPKTFLRNHVFGKLRGNKDTARGNYGEGLARLKYTELTGIEVIKSGVHVNSTEPWLAASPDGLISTDSIFEVKCPDPDKFEGYFVYVWSILYGWEGDSCLVLNWNLSNSVWKSLLAWFRNLCFPSS